MSRCAWATREPSLSYHDEEWGVPVYDDRVLFEFLILEGAQAGLSWEMILNKRAGYRKAFSDFDAEKVAAYTEADVERLMLDSSIVRNRLKIQSTLSNAQALLKLQQEHGSFSAYIWDFVNGTPIVNQWSHIQEMPVSTPLSDRISKELKKRGFRFVGTTICYSFMQAVGLVNDHTLDCTRKDACNPTYEKAD
jgi:DNA-3-methyladenine glycosylase I